MTELNVAHHLSMGSNFEDKQHIGWKIYLKNSTTFKMRIASWEGCFIICYCTRWTFSVVLLYMFSLRGLSTFFPFFLVVNTFWVLKKISLTCSYFTPLSVAQLLFCISLGPLARFILMKILGMLPSVSNWGCLYFYCVC